MVHKQGETHVFFEFSICTFFDICRGRNFILQLSKRGVKTKGDYGKDKVDYRPLAKISCGTLENLGGWRGERPCLAGPGWSPKIAQEISKPLMESLVSGSFGDFDDCWVSATYFYKSLFYPAACFIAGRPSGSGSGLVSLR